LGHARGPNPHGRNRPQDRPQTDFRFLFAVRREHLLLGGDIHPSSGEAEWPEDATPDLHREDTGASSRQLARRERQSLERGGLCGQTKIYTCTNVVVGPEWSPSRGFRHKATRTHLSWLEAEPPDTSTWLPERSVSLRVHPCSPYPPTCVPRLPRAPPSRK